MAPERPVASPLADDSVRDVTSPSLVLDDLLEALVLPSFSRVGPVVRSRLFRWSPLPSPWMGRVLLTGASSGLGAAMAEHLVAVGAEVTTLSRRVPESLVARGVRALSLDIADLAAVREVVGGIEDSFDVVIHNAGALSATRTLTPQGVESTFACHVLAPFLMSRLVRLGVGARVILMTSGGLYTQELDLSQLEMGGDYRGTVAYARAKRAQLALVEAWTRADPDHSYFAVHPGWTDTPGLRHSLPTFSKVLRPLLRTPRQGVDTALWLATTADRPTGGGLWLDRRARPTHRGRRRDRATPEELVAFLDERLDAALAPPT